MVAFILEVIQDIFVLMFLKNLIFYVNIIIRAVSKFAPLIQIRTIGRVSAVSTQL